MLKKSAVVSTPMDGFFIDCSQNFEGLNAKTDNTINLKRVKFESMNDVE